MRDFREELQDLEHDVFGSASNRDVTGRLYDMQRELLILKLAATPSRRPAQGRKPEPA